CGITTTGEAYCWGSNLYGGALGTGDSSRDLVTTTPVRVAGRPPFATITAGTARTCGITTVGVGYCWGDSRRGPLGTGDTVNSAPTPVPVAGGLSFKALTAGFAQTCALTLAGTAYCWGVATAGLGVDTTSGCFRATRCTTPTPVVGGLTFSALGPASRQPGYS